MNFVPSAAKSTLAAPRTPDTASDLLQQPVEPVSHQVNDSHPLEARLRGWQTTKEELHFETLRQVYGAAEPIRRAMEQAIVADSFVPACMDGPSNLHLDILKNRDATITWEDVHRDEPKLSFHDELERRMTA